MCGLRGRRHADDAGNILGSGAPPSLLRAAVQQGADLEPAADVEKAYALRPAELMRAHRKEIREFLPEKFSERQLAVDLHQVAVQRNIPLAAECEQFPERLQGPGLIVCPHAGDERRSMFEQSLRRTEIRTPLTGDREQRKIQYPRPLSVAQRLQYGVMLNLRCDQERLVSALPRRFRRGEQRPVIRLGSPGGKIEFLGQAAKRLRETFPRCGECLPRSSAALVERRGVSVLLRQKGEHGLECLRAERHRRRVVQINHGFSPSSRR